MLVVDETIDGSELVTLPRAAEQREAEEVGARRLCATTRHDQTARRLWPWAAGDALVLGRPQ